MPRHTTLVFVSFNSAHLLRLRLEAFSNLPIVVVDNASSDGTASDLAADFPSVHWIENPVNSGYGRAANRGLETVETRYALLLNPDVEIGLVEIDALECEADKLGDGWLFVAPETGLAPQPGPTEGVDADPLGLARVRMASGAALFFHRANFESLGGFDPNIFLFFEETDLCRRAEASGLSMYHAPAIRVGHEIGTSSERTAEIDYVRKWHYQWSLLYFCRKHRLWARFLVAVLKNRVVAAWKLRARSRDDRRYALNHARYDSARWYLKGGQAFLESGEPYRSSFLEELARKVV